VKGRRGEEEIIPKAATELVFYSFDCLSIGLKMGVRDGGSKSESGKKQ
jgi:hypothetical protein